MSQKASKTAPARDSRNIIAVVGVIAAVVMIGALFLNGGRSAAPANPLAAGQTFLARNAQEPGVMTTASGLQYKVITEGSGAQPTATDTVTVHYRGTLIDGTEFDSSYSRGEPISFPLNGVIPGWTEGLQLMTVGSKYILYIPSELGYGAQGAGAAIPPNSTLIFEVELLGIN
jgi:FKBP-type peptidyl-prolyl cis-trans isomerase